MRGLIYGMTVGFVEKFRAEEIERILANETVTIMSVVPFMLKKLIQQQRIRLIRTIIQHFVVCYLGADE